MLVFCEYFVGEYSYFEVYPMFNGKLV